MFMNHMIREYIENAPQHNIIENMFSTGTHMSFGFIVSPEGSDIVKCLIRKAKINKLVN